MFLRLRYTLRHLSLAALAVSTLLTVGLTACGKKGPLYVPDDMKRPPEQTPAAPAK